MTKVNNQRLNDLHARSRYFQSIAKAYSNSVGRALSDKEIALFRVWSQNVTA